MITETFKIIRQIDSDQASLNQHLDLCESSTLGRISRDSLENHATLYFYFKNDYRDSGINYGDPMDRELNFVLNPKCKHKTDYDSHESWFTMPYGEIKNWFPTEIDELLMFHQSSWNPNFHRRITINLHIKKDTVLKILERIEKTFLVCNIYEFPDPEFIGISEEEEKSIPRGNPDLLPGCTKTGLLITTFEEFIKDLDDIEIIKEVCKSI